MRLSTTLWKTCGAFVDCRDISTLWENYPDWILSRASVFRRSITKSNTLNNKVFF